MGTSAQLGLGLGERPPQAMMLGEYIGAGNRPGLFEPVMCPHCHKPFATAAARDRHRVRTHGQMKLSC